MLGLGVGLVVVIVVGLAVVPLNCPVSIVGRTGGSSKYDSIRRERAGLATERQMKRSGASLKWRLGEIPRTAS